MEWSKLRSVEVDDTRVFKPRTKFVDAESVYDEKEIKVKKKIKKLGSN